MLLILWDGHVSVMWPSCEKHISLRENEERVFLCCRIQMTSSAHLEMLSCNCLQMSGTGLPTSVTHTHTQSVWHWICSVDNVLFEGRGALADPVETLIRGSSVWHRVPSPHHTGQVHSWVIELHISCQDYFRPSSCIVRQAQTVYVIVLEMDSGQHVLLVSGGAITKDQPTKNTFTTPWKFA